MDAEYVIVEQIAIWLVPDMCAYIMKLVEDHHIDLGLIKWKKCIISLNEEYKARLGSIFDDSDDDDVIMPIVVNFDGEEPFEFDDDYSRRMYNHRKMIDYKYNSEDNRKGGSRHFPPIIISNSMKICSTGVLISPNHYYQVLYKSETDQK